MNDATAGPRSKSTSPPTIRPGEAAHFGRLAQEWWDPGGSSAMLHRLNPVRLAFIRDAIDAHWQTDPADLRPLAGRAALDVGCGAGLLCEPLARLGADVTGVDAAPENVAAAAAHAELMGFDTLLPQGEGSEVGGLPSATAAHPSSTPSLKAWGSLRYMAGEVGALDIGRFDLVTAMEVIEHVADKPAFVAALAARLAPDGLLVLSTPNRTVRSRLLLVEGAEALGLIPRGTHQWHDFVTPEEMGDLLREAGLAVRSVEGLAFTPSRGLHLSQDRSLNYILSATRAER